MSTLTDRADPTAPARDNPGVIAPPPLLFSGALIAGIAIGALAGGIGLGLPPIVRYVGAGALFLAAAPLAVGALRQFKASGTNAPPPLPATALVTAGVYRFTRNPMYLSLSCLYASLALVADSAVAAGLLAPLLLVVRYGVIAREERYLGTKFGTVYKDYRSRVRRWV